MKKLISLISFVLVLVMLTSGATVFGEGAFPIEVFKETGIITEGDFTYTVGKLYAYDDPNDVDDIPEEEAFVGNVARLDKYDGNAAELIIPSEVEGNTIYEIGANAFENSKIKKVTIPDTLIHIANSSFVNCSDLQTIDIGKAALMSGPVYSVSSFVTGCPSLKEIIVSPENEYYEEGKYGELIWKGTKYQEKTLVLFPACAECDSYYTGDIKVIDWRAFAEANILRSVIVNGKAVVVKSNAFADSSVVSVWLKDDCTVYGETFNNTDSLKYVFYQGTEEQWVTPYEYSEWKRADSVEGKDIKVIFNAKDVTKVFVDVKTSSWFRGAVDHVFNSGLMVGVLKDKFEPNTAMTRAMLVTVLWRAEGSPATETKTPFTDLKAKWYKSAVEWAYKNGIVDGMGEGKFAPDGKLTREQISTIMFRYAEYKKGDTSARTDLSGYKDASKIHSYAKDAVSWAVASGLIKGVKADELDPRGNATRAQVATIMLRSVS